MPRVEYIEGAEDENGFHNLVEIIGGGGNMGYTGGIKGKRALNQIFLCGLCVFFIIVVKIYGPETMKRPARRKQEYHFQSVFRRIRCSDITNDRFYVFEMKLKPVMYDFPMHALNCILGRTIPNSDIIGSRLIKRTEALICKC